MAQRESLDTETRNGLWSVLMVTFFERVGANHLYRTPEVESVMRSLWLNFFKLPIDTLPDWGPKAIASVREYFFKAEWYGTFDLVEFLAQPRFGDDLPGLANTILEREMSAYRFVGVKISEITSKEEIAEVEAAVDSAPKGAQIHLQRAVSLLSDRANPDYRNSIKESISAVEATLNDLSGTTSLTLGEALKRLDLDVHGAFRAALGNLYGYTNDSDGIRHSLLEEPNLDYIDAKFMLVACSAFVNYLVGKRAGQSN